MNLELKLQMACLVLNGNLFPFVVRKQEEEKKRKYTWVVALIFYRVSVGLGVAEADVMSLIVGAAEKRKEPGSWVVLIIVILSSFWN